MVIQYVAIPLEMAWLEDSSVKSMVLDVCAKIPEQAKSSTQYNQRNFIFITLPFDKAN